MQVGNKEQVLQCLGVRLSSVEHEFDELSSNGCGLDISVEEGEIVAFRGRAVVCMRACSKSHASRVFPYCSSLNKSKLSFFSFVHFCVDIDQDISTLDIKGYLKKR